MLLIAADHFLLQITDSLLIVFLHLLKFVANGMDVLFETIDGELTILFNLLVL